MKKWYMITSILALLLVISMSTCSSNSSQVDRLEDDLKGLETESGSAKTQLAQSEAMLDGVKAELTQLKAMKEISFGNGLKVFGIEKGYYEVQGKIENVSSEPMQKVVVVVAFYNKDGQLDEDWGSVDTCAVRDLFPGEVMEWKVHFGNWTEQDIGLFDVYAIGNSKD